MAAIRATLKFATKKSGREVPRSGRNLEEVRNVSHHFIITFHATNMVHETIQSCGKYSIVTKYMVIDIASLASSMTSSVEFILVVC